MQLKECVLATYDIRGIQDYVFRTPAVKEAIGASSIVDRIIENALIYGIDTYRKKSESNISSDLSWYVEENGGVRVPAAFNEDALSDVTVLYIGGGNAYVLFSSAELCVDINRLMSKYIIDETYSLQLVCAFTSCTGNYRDDYQKVFEKLSEAKAEMVYSQPLGALPMMKVEVKSGLPLSADKKIDNKSVSYESACKRIEEIDKRYTVRGKKFDEYVTEKGVDSTIAVVHIDGNNMGLRIRNRMESFTGYKEAVEEVRRISLNIDFAYSNAFSKMMDHFNTEALKNRAFAEKAKNFFVLKVLTAGDDITYVCNGLIALSTVEYFCRELAKYSMTGDTDENSMKAFGFSACAGIAYIGSHFPFSVGYEVAENCCESAKDTAKSEAMKDVVTVDGKQYERIGNWVDFQICKNVYAKDLERIRKEEYRTPEGEELLIRPYFLRVRENDPMNGKVNPEKTFDDFKNNIRHFQEKSNIPRNYAKKFRNIYPDGEKRTSEFYAFLKSRAHKLPGGSEELYLETGDKKTARWYDALEMLDYYVDIDETPNVPEQERNENE